MNCRYNTCSQSDSQATVPDTSCSSHLPLLALDTAGESCSAALFLADGRLLTRHTGQPRQHTTRLFSFIDELLDAASMPKSALQGIACGQGPGGFTGVRIAIAVSQGLALALNVPLIGVNSLQAIACGAINQQPKSSPFYRDGARIAVATDARMGESYAQMFIVKSGIAVPENPATLLAMADLPQWVQTYKPDALCGSAFNTLNPQQDCSDVPVLPEVASHAAAIAQLAAQPETSQAITCHDPAQLAPVYLRNQVTHQR